MHVKIHWSNSVQMWMAHQQWPLRSEASQWRVQSDPVWCRELGHLAAEDREQHVKIGYGITILIYIIYILTLGEFARKRFIVLNITNDAGWEFETKKGGMVDIEVHRKCDHYKLINKLTMGTCWLNEWVTHRPLELFPGSGSCPPLLLLAPVLPWCQVPRQNPPQGLQMERL